MHFHISFIIFIVLSLTASCSQPQGNNTLLESDPKEKMIVTGAEQTDIYFPVLYEKRIAVVANQTSMVCGVHLVDTLLESGFDIVKVFGPEHGFRGDQGAGIEIKDDRDIKTGLPIISLYGDHKKPTQNDLYDVDLVIFDIQDVGVRFYTYISTMTYIMEACAENNVAMLVLDRPNPHGFYVDGPVLDKENGSFVGLHSVPIVHGMTVGEYAMMVNGEGWLKGGIQCSLEVITVENYDHSDIYVLPIPPSPNLPNQRAVILYPSLCLFEGTDISIGRGTDFPFQCFGHPDFEEEFSFSFTPVPIPTKSIHPKHQNEICYGVDMRNDNYLSINRLNLDYLLSCYISFNDKSAFFNSFFVKLAGINELREQIESNWSELEIKETWEDEIMKFKTLRKKYLLYNDFE